MAVLTAAPTAAAAPPLVPRELDSLSREPRALLQLARDGAPFAKRLRAAGGTEVSPSLRIWELPSGAARRLVPQLASSGALLDFEPSWSRSSRGHIAGGDRLVGRQWWLSRVGADRAEPPRPGRPLVVVDSGVDLTHPEFADRPNTTALNRQTSTGRPSEAHGTAVASVAAAPVNGIGVVGAYPQAVLRVWDASPFGALSAADVIEGIEHGSSLGRSVINLSLGGPERSRLEEQAVLAAFGRGSLVVAAAGNDGETGSPPEFPASLPHVVTVASTDGVDRVSSFSTRTPGIDVSAPGEDIPVAVPVAFSTTGYVLQSGTSLSAPIVSGAAAWIWTVRPQLDNTQLFELLRRSARDVGSPGRDLDTGFGIVDIPTALAVPAPSPDRHEPNDSLDQVATAGLLARVTPALTSPRRPSTAVTARLDAVDDPQDVYRVWVGAVRRVTVTVSSSQDVDLRPGPRRFPVSRRVLRPGLERLTVANRGRAGGYVYVAVSPGAGTSAAEYRLTIASVRAPR